jgi:hypothetical protein
VEELGDSIFSVEVQIKEETSVKQAMKVRLTFSGLHGYIQEGKTLD